MKKTVPAALFAAFLLAACVVRPGYRGEPVIVPILPPLVVLGMEPYYFHGGYHYHYRDDRWFYSTSRGGPWTDLPRDRWPKETRFDGERPGRR